MKKRLFSLFILCIFVLSFSNSFVIAATNKIPLYDIVYGLKKISLSYPGSLEFTNDAWTTLVSGDNANENSKFVAARNYGNGRIMAIGHEGMLTGKNIYILDNLKLIKNSIKWLNNLGNKRIGFSYGHGEFVDGYTIANLKKELVKDKYSVYPKKLTDKELKTVDVLIVGNAWKSFSASEISAVEKYISNGGGVLLTGLGWSFYQNGPKTKYPMEVLSAKFGVKWDKTVITSTSESYNGCPVLSVFYEDLNFLSSDKNIRVSSPYEGSGYYIGDTVSIDAHAPNAKKMTIQYDQKNIYTVKSSSITYKLKTDGQNFGSHVIMVNAYDSNGVICGKKQINITLEPKAELVTLYGKKDFSSSNINIVFLAEGYTNETFSKFEDAVKARADKILSVSPIDQYKSKINIFYMKTMSNEGVGVDSPNDTYFGLFEKMTEQQRGEASLKMKYLVDHQLNNNAICIVLANSGFFGEFWYHSRTIYSSYGQDGSDADVSMHELGHDLGFLADEYPGGYKEECAPNVSQNSDINTIKWKDFLSEGARVIPVTDTANNTETGWYKPYDNCIMNGNPNEFCKVCNQALRTQMDRFTAKDPNHTVYEAENASLSDLKTYTDKSASSESFVGSDVKGKGSILFKDIKVDNSGYYVLQFGYENKNALPASYTLTINGRDEQVLKFPSTPASASVSNWKKVSVITKLNKGNNTIGINKPDANSNINLDYINVAKRYEAEDAITNNVKFHYCWAASGYSFIYDMTHADSYLKFDNINVPAAGVYKMKIVYSNAEQTGGVKLLVNNELNKKISLPLSQCGLAHGVGDAVIKEVKLNKGINTISFLHDSGNVYLDYIELLN